jgi:hypothetical protein
MCYYAFKDEIGETAEVDYASLWETPDTLIRNLI